MKSWTYYPYNWKKDYKKDLVVIKNVDKVSACDEILNNIRSKTSDYYFNILKRKERAEKELVEFDDREKHQYWNRRPRGNNSSNEVIRLNNKK